MSDALQISSDRFIAGVEFERDKVVRAAPIVKYMRGWSRKRVLDYCDKKGWKTERGMLGGTP